MELRRVTRTNHSHAQQVIELTSYAEVVLALPAIMVAAKGLKTPVQAGQRRAALLIVAMLLLFLPLDLVVNRAENIFKSGRTFALKIKEHAGPTAIPKGLLNAPSMEP